MDEPPPPRASRPPISAPFALLALSLGCTASVLLALVAALLGKGVPPLYLLAVPPTLVVAWLIGGGRGILTTATKHDEDHEEDGGR